MGNQEIADFDFFFSYIINLHQAGFFLPSLSLSPHLVSQTSSFIIQKMREMSVVIHLMTQGEYMRFSGVPLSFGTGKCSAHFPSETIEHISWLSNAFKGTPRSPIDWGFWRSFSSFLTGSFVMWQLCRDKMPSVRPVMMYMYISEQLMSTTSSFRLIRLRQEEKK